MSGCCTPEGTCHTEPAEDTVQAVTATADPAEAPAEGLADAGQGSVGGVPA
ncbi:hypothetical protein [Streptomyces sp. NPDC053367]|uniref:hypothetical protein n=1 Tax=Streptomyces sp. NPDC053367 TaxID=3365700 RepID=UPI0037CD0F74